ALFIGSVPAILRVLNHMWPVLPKPVLWYEHRRLSPPPPQRSSLILENAQQLDIADQQELLDWLRQHSPSPRLIATAPYLPVLADGPIWRELGGRLSVVEVAAA